MPMPRMTCTAVPRTFLTLALFFSAIGPVAAAGLGPLAHCQLVPYANFNDDENVSVGLISQSGGTIRWLFFDQDGRRVDAGDFRTQDGEFLGFSLASNASASLGDTLGFLMFCLDDNNDGRLNFDDNPDLSANALLVRANDADAVYLPVLPVFVSDIEPGNFLSDIDDWTNDPIDELLTGAGPDEKLYMRYFTDGVENSGDDTTIYLFTAGHPDNEIDVEAVGPGAVIDAELLLGQFRLNVIDPETVTGLADSDLIGSGYLVWEIPDDIRSAFAFSLVSSPAFGAVQSLVGSVGTD